MNPNYIGKLGESKFLYELTRLDWSVFTEFSNVSPVDMIILKDGTTLKCQIKASTQSDENSVTFDLRSKTHNYTKIYTSDEIDLFLLYDVNNDICIYYPFEESRSTVSFRYTKTKNQQAKGIRFADDYAEIELPK